jgi:hypothetical protein
MTEPSKPPQIHDEYNLSEALQATNDELVDLTEKREQLDRRIAKLQSDRVHLAALCGAEIDDPIKQLGLTDAVRHLFGRAGAPASRKQIVEMLERSYDVSTYKNLPANVHTIVRRLLKSGEIKQVAPGVLGRIGEQEMYQWAKGIAPPPPALPVNTKFFIEDAPTVEPSELGRMRKITKP